MPAPHPIAWLDGGFLPAGEARVSPFDRAFLFGDAVYEVLPVYGGRVFRLAQHLDRLDRSLAGIRMEPAHDRATWTRILGGLIARNGGGDMSLYVQVTRGAEFGRNHMPPPGLTPTVFAFAAPLPPPDPGVLERGIDCITSDDIRWSRCDIKATSLLANILSKWHALDMGAAEALLIRNGLLMEGASSSVFLVRGGRLVTPPDSPWLLPGTTRDALLELAGRLSIPVDVRDIAAGEIASADEIWIAAALAQLKAVTRVDGRPVGDGSVGPVFRRLYRAFEDAKPEFSTECPP
jgi:D-alanine transaminase